MHRVIQSSIRTAVAAMSRIVAAARNETWRRNGAGCLVVLVVSLVHVARAEAPATQPDVEYLRFVDNDDGSSTLESSVVTFRRDDVTVALYAAVHIGDRAYYDALNTAFTNYDTVLYEMVKPRHVPPPPPGQFGDGGVNLIQRMMQHVTQLEYQLDIIDYTEDNFVHADMDFENFAAAMAERNEISRMMLRAMAAGGQSTQVHPDVLLGQFLMAAQDPAEANNLKRMLAREFANLDEAMRILEGPEGSVLLTERNKAAITVLERELRRGRTRLALFYGAAHVPDLGERLVELGFEPVQTEWLAAWSIAPPPATQPAHNDDTAG